MTDHTILEGDVMDGLRTLPDRVIQCTVTSPPYWMLRNYGVDGQIGLEETMDGYIQKIVGIFHEVKRVTRDDGVLWLNLGDCYSGSNSTKGDMGQTLGGIDKAKGVVEGLKQKDICGIPWRIAFALQADGWYLRSDIIWNKPNPMPESVTDRPTKSHEYIFLLTKNPRYFYDAEAIREDATTNENRPMGCERARSYEGKLNLDDNAPEQFKKKANKQDQIGNPTYTGFNERWKNRKQMECDSKVSGGSKNLKGHSGNFGPNGEPKCDGITRNARTVWTITTQARPEAHFATFPDEIPRRCISAGTSEYGCCPKCGKPWERVIERNFIAQQDVSAEKGIRGSGNQKPMDKSNQWEGFPRGTTENKTIRWQPGCSCNAGEPVPCIVLDPFLGSGTTMRIARDLGRSSIGCELNPAYIKIVRKLLQTDSQLDTGTVSYRFEKVS